MIIKKVIDICKKIKNITLYEGNGVQWVSDGRAIYPLYGMPRFDQEKLAKTFDISEEKISKMTFLHEEKLPGTFNFDDCDDDEIVCERAWMDFCDGTITYTTSDGIAFLREVHLAPLADIPPDMMTVYERINRAGTRYYAVKSGFILQAIILPCYAVDERLAEKTERIAKLCRSELVRKNQISEREDI